MRTSKIVFAFAGGLLAAGVWLAMRGQMCEPVTLIVPGIFGALFAALMHDEGN